MKIGIPLQKQAQLDDLKLDMNLHGSKYFGIYNTINKTIKTFTVSSITGIYLENGFINFIKSEGINCIVSPNCQSMTAKFFKDNDIAIYKAFGTDLKQNIRLLENSELFCFNEESIIQKSNCSSECKSCSSSCNEEIQHIVAI
ncbi:MAG: hypothetical protein PF517_05235 [Salinivirgaceae bacterium]|jgi:predicted Fe-Mo cluster-binding NifX family protein|nr:hypothetical protein [Salinivirgaceae bacterium]